MKTLTCPYCSGPAAERIDFVGECLRNECRKVFQINEGTASPDFDDHQGDYDPDTRLEKCPNHPGYTVHVPDPEDPTIFVCTECA